MNMMKNAFLSLALLALSASADVPTYCNPMSLPGIPISRNTRNPKPGEADRLQHRELADPSLLAVGRTLYVYPSNDMAWKSTDGGASWRKIDIGVHDIGYAPTIVRHKNRYLLCAGIEIYASASPEGPFKKIGYIPWPGGVPGPADMNLFSDGNRLFLYYGCSPKDGIWGVELEGDNPCKMIGKPVQLIPFEPETQAWECKPHNVKESWIEGAWMVKINGRYCLTYSSSGTEHARYAMGAAWSDRPLGPFVKQRRNPFFRKTTGLVTGIGHGSVIPFGNELLVSYCVYSGVLGGFERLIGFDRLRLDRNGELAVQEATETPQYADGSGAAPWATAPFRSDHPEMTDSRLKTFARMDGPLPVMTVFTCDFSVVVRAYRLIWRDCGLKGRMGLDVGGYRYRIEYRDGETWKTLVDASRSSDDLFVDYRETPAVRTRELRLTVLGAPEGATPGVTEFTVFGE